MKLYVITKIGYVLNNFDQEELTAGRLEKITDFIKECDEESRKAVFDNLFVTKKVAEGIIEDTERRLRKLDLVEFGEDHGRFYGDSSETHFIEDGICVQSHYGDESVEFWSLTINITIKEVDLITADDYED